MSHRITIAGAGAVSSAGWGVESLWRAVEAGAPLPSEALPHPSGDPGLARSVRRVPRPDPRPAFLAHPRLRRASAISHFAAAAALEAVGPEHLATIRNGTLRTGIVCSLLNGSVNYSARFHAEVLKDPATASPMLFPETVFNAPASHVAALLGITAPITTVLGDTAQFFPAVEIAIQWLLDDVVDTCLVIGVEEADWLTAEALALLAPGAVLSEGAGALYLEKNGPGPLVAAVHGPCPVLSGRTAAAVRLFGDIIPSAEMLLITDRSGDSATDAPTAAAVGAWPGPQSHPRLVLGESLGAAAALQSVLAVKSLTSGSHSSVLAAATGGNMQAAALELHFPGH
ncbi:MAG: beta-ketoacyl synthase N-terminal-like domain-containing protein [Verrucomicrobiota bacterium]